MNAALVLSFQRVYGYILNHEALRAKRIKTKILLLFMLLFIGFCL